MNEFIGISILILVVEICILLRIVHSFRVIKKDVIGKKDFKDLLELYIEEGATEDKDSKFHWIKSLCWSVGRKASIWDLKTIIRSVYEGQLLRIKINSNLGPAIGILATFFGLGLTLYKVYKYSGQDTMFKSEIGGLFPVMVGGFAGILVYAIGNSIYRKAESVVSTHEKIYLGVFFEFDDEARLSKARNIEEIYEGLLEHVSKLVRKFTTISQKYDGLNKSLDTNIERLDTTMGANLGKLNSGVESYLNGINSNLNKYIDDFGKTKDELLNGSQAKIDSYLEKVDENSQILHEKMKVNLEELNDRFENYISKIDGNLVTYIDDFSTTKDELLRNSQANIETYLKKINQIYESINSTTSKSSERLLSDTKKMFSSLTGINKDFITQFEEKTSKQLESITKQVNQTHNVVGTLLKTLGDTYRKNLKSTSQLLERVDEYQSNLKTSSKSISTLSNSLQQVTSSFDKLQNSVVLYLQNIDAIQAVTKEIDKQNKSIGDFIKVSTDNVMNVDHFVKEVKKIKDFFERADEKALIPLTDLALAIKKLPDDWMTELTTELKEIKQYIKSPESIFHGNNQGMPYDSRHASASLPNYETELGFQNRKQSMREKRPKIRLDKSIKKGDIQPGRSNKDRDGRENTKRKKSIEDDKYSAYIKGEKKKSRFRTRDLFRSVSKIFRKEE